MKIPTIRAALLAAVVASLAGCWHGRLLYCAEAPFWASLGEELPVKASLAWQALRHGWWPRFLLVGPQENPRDRLSAALSGGRFGAAVVGPLLSFEAAGFAQGFPATGFVLVDGPSWAAGSVNTALLLFDRTPAYQSAGRAAALSLAADPRGGLAGVLAPIGSAAGDPEVQAFLRGFAAGVEEAGGAGLPVMSEIELPADAEKVKAAVAQMRGQGVEVFLPRLGGLTGAFLEALRDKGGSAVTADWAASGAFAGQVFLSVEEDVPAGIGLCLGPSGGAGAVVQGPVKLVCGRARQVPRELKGKVDCR